MASKQGRVKALIDKNIRDILLFELKDPKVGMCSVSEVSVNSDNSLAKVYVSFFGNPHPHNAFKELEKHEGFVRSALAKRMDTYKVPEVKFVYDDSYEKEAHLEELLQKEESDIEAAKKGQKQD